jgi:hypothetical protein
VSTLWAITAYFNPARYARRLANYRVFREHLAVPLVAVELAFEDDFQLAGGDAEILIQLRSGDLMWQKERLLNLALEALPPRCRNVAWLDCDVVFGSDDWAARAERRLEEVPLLQPFRQARYLTEEATAGTFHPEDARSDRLSIACLSASGVPVTNWLNVPGGRRPLPAVGLAWAARRAVLERHPFYDACIIGGGDRAMIAAADGTPREFAESRHMRGSFLVHYLRWASSFRTEGVDANRFIDGEVFHLWHGTTRNRAYTDRHEGLSRFAFDPLRDIAMSENGTWRWSSDKPEMHAYVRDYLLSRREDG